jgi:deoxyribose-phosphate aldolase
LNAILGAYGTTQVAATIYGPDRILPHMTEQEKKQLIDRLERRFSRSHPESHRDPVSLHAVFDRMVDAGACRFGLRVEHNQRNGFSACDLAPPLARMIDHTALKAETTETQIRSLCQEALKYCFASVCVNTCYVPLASELLSGSEVAVCTVVGFPLGASASDVKAFEAAFAIREGATEIDMVMNVGKLKSGRHGAVEADIRAVVEACEKSAGGGGQSIVSKVIIETALLTDEEKVIASILAQNAGADYVKTSTGFSSGGATAADVALMRRAVGPDMGVKASGGVRTRKDAEALIAHGATRIGASASVAIIKELAGAG